MVRYAPVQTSYRPSSSHYSHRRSNSWLKTVIIFLVLGGLAYGVWYWGKAQGIWSPEEPLAPLVSESLASRDLLNMHLLDATDYSGAGWDNLVGNVKDRKARVTRRFEPPAGNVPGAVAAITDYAGSRGWAKISQSQEPRLEVSMTKTHPGGGTMQARIFDSSTRIGTGAVTIEIVWLD
jgi:hypothetical protein